MKKKIHLSSPHMSAEGYEMEYIQEAFDTNWIAPLGANVNGFEAELSEKVGVKTGAAMTTGTAAIHIALRLLKVQVGDYVFCSSFTFSGSCNPIIYEKCTPVFIDADPETWNMSPKALGKAFEAHEKEGKLPKAVIIVNLYGQSADFDALIPICKKYGVPIIEDAAESLGATYKDKQTGSFGDFGIFSFNGNKIITTSGGGMLVSDDTEAIEKARFMITQARDPQRHYQHSEVGYNYRMSNVVAGIGRGQLKVLEHRVMQKREIYEYYKKAFADISDIEMMPIASYGEPNYWLSAITIKKGTKVQPEEIMEALQKEDIESRPLWKPMHMQPVFSMYPFYAHDNHFGCIAEDLFHRGVCLPSDTKMDEKDLANIVKIVKSLFA